MHRELATAARLATTIALVSMGWLPKSASAAEESRSLDESQTAAAQRDIYAVPDGEPAELLDFITRLLNAPPADRSPEGIQQHGNKQIASSLEAASKVLASGEATSEQAVRAAEIKLQLLMIAAGAGMDGKQEQLDAFKKALREDERNSVRAVIVQRDLIERIRQWPRFQEDERDQYIADFVALLKSIDVETAHGKLAYEVARIIGEDDPEAAATLSRQAAPIFAASKDDGVSQFADGLERLVRYLSLVGNPMSIEGRRLDGSEFDWSQYEGKVVLVDFWATWCGPCIAEMPNVLANYAQYHDKGFEVVGVSLDTNRDEVQRFVEQNGIPWPILFHARPEEQRWDHPLAVQYGIDAIPAAILVGKDAKVISKNARGDELGRQLHKLLGEPQLIALDDEDGGVRTTNTERP